MIYTWRENEVYQTTGCTNCLSSAHFALIEYWYCGKCQGWEWKLVSPGTSPSSEMFDKLRICRKRHRSLFLWSCFMSATTFIKCFWSVWFTLAFFMSAESAVSCKYNFFLGGTRNFLLFCWLVNSCFGVLWIMLPSLLVSFQQPVCFLLEKWKT